MPRIHHPLFDDAANVRGRLRIADKLPLRHDIHDHATTLIALQDGGIDPVDVKLTSSERALGRYMDQVIGYPAFAEDEQAPVGLKLPPLYCSPLLHLERALRRQRSDYSDGPHLPRSIDELEEYLHEAMQGIFRDDAEKSGALCEDDAMSRTLREEARFEKTTGVKIRAVAEFLFAIRTTHPELFLLLLSFEIEETQRLLPCLAYQGGANKARAWRDVYFGKAKCSILEVFEIIRILRRGTDIVHALSVKRHFTVSEVRQVVAKLRKGASVAGDKAALTSVMLSVYATRKIVLNDIDRHDDVRGQRGRAAFHRRASDKGTLLSLTCLPIRDTAYAADVLEDYIDNVVMNLPFAGPLPETPSPSSAIEVARIPGAGKSQGEQLFSFYGLTGEEIASLVAIEVGAVLSKGLSGRSSAALANTILDRLWKGASEIRNVHISRMAKVMPLVFPTKGKFRHSCGFARSSWVEIDADARQWRALAEGAEADLNDPYAALFVATRRYLHGFSAGVARLGQLEEAARIFCYLSHSMGLLAHDPVWIRLLDRAKFIAGINLKNDPAANDRAELFGPGPKAFEELVRAVG